MPFNPEAFISRFGGWTESYSFYNGSIELRYDPKAHVYFLVTGDKLEKQAGVTSVCHIIDKSEALLPWGCKMMAKKLMDTVPTIEDGDGLRHVFLDIVKFEDVVLAAKTAHKDHLDDAGEVGHVAHAWIENFIKAQIAKDVELREHLLGRMPEEQRANNCCTAALDWMNQHNVRWLCTERKIYSRSHKYAGTMDGLCLVDSCSDPNCCPHPFKDRLSVADWKTSNSLYMEYLMQTAAYEFAYEEETGEEVEDRWVIRLGKDDAEFETWHMEADTFCEDLTAFITALNLYHAVDSIKDRIKERAGKRRAIEKERKRIEKEAALKLACKNSAKYKGTRKPVCNGGNPCVSCLQRYAEKHPAKG